MVMNHRIARDIARPQPVERPTAWAPDPMLVDAARNRRLDFRTLPADDVDWLVAQLTALNLPTDDIAEMLKCSRRLVQQKRCTPVGVLTGMVIKLEKQAQPKCGHQAYIRQLETQVQVLRKSRDDLLDVLFRQRPNG